MTKHASDGAGPKPEARSSAQGSFASTPCVPAGIDTGIIPQAQRTQDAVFMTPDNVADEVLTLFMVEESGATWAKVRDSKPAWIIQPPGQKNRSN